MSRALAQEEPSPLSSNRDRLRARELAEAAVKAQEHKDLDGALRYLEQAYRLYPTPKILYSLGVVRRQQKRSVEGADLLRRYLHEVGAELEPARRREVEKLLAEPRRAAGEIFVAGERGAFVLLDDRVIGVLPLSLPLLASVGSHRLRLERGHRQIETKVSVVANQEVRLSLEIPRAVVLLSYIGRSLAGFSRQIQEAIAESIAGQRLAVVPQESKDAMLAGNGKLKRCLIPEGGQAKPSGKEDLLPCQEELARMTEAQAVLSVSVRSDRREPMTSAQEERTFYFDAQLLDAETGAVGDSGEATCPSCSLSSATQVLADLVKNVVRRGVGRSRGLLHITSEPVARLVLDGREQGVTPYRRKAFAGQHEALLSQGAYQAQKSLVTVSEGQTAELFVKLQPEVRKRLVRTDRPTWQLVTGTLVAGVGLALVGIGASALAIDGKCAGGEAAVPMFPVMACERVYRSLAPGAGMTAAGSVLAIAGAVVIALPGPKKLMEVSLRTSTGSGRAGLDLVLAGRF